MSYKLNKTDGTLLTDLIDGVLDTSTTDLALVGRNYTGFGEYINENFIKLLENFANPNEPVTPMRGQLWYDTSENKLKIYDGTTFQSAAGSFVDVVTPTGAIAGDTWFSTVDKQFYLFDGTEWTLIGPAYSQIQGQSGFVVESIVDEASGLSQTILRLDIGNGLIGILSPREFQPRPTQLTSSAASLVQSLITTDNPKGRIYAGINIISQDVFLFRGVSLYAKNLKSDTGEIVSESQLLKNDEDGVLFGSFSINNSSGLTIGQNNDTRLLIENGFTIKNTRQGQDFHIVVNSSASQLSETDAFTIKANTQRVGIFNSAPAYNLDVTGDMRITGNLTVEGDSVTTQVQTVQVEDKNIELGVTTGPTDTSADGGGITLKGATDKTFAWSATTSSWTSSEHIDLAVGKGIKYNGSMLLDSTRLYDTVTTATGITQVGTLSILTVDDLRLDGSTITRIGSGTGITINTGSNGGVIGPLSVSSANITNLAEPTSSDHAASKIYVDREIQNEPVVFALDVTNYVSVNDRIIDILDVVYPPSTFAQGKQARVICTDYNAAQSTDPINVSASSSTTEVDVNAAAGGTVSVIQGVNLPESLTPSFSLIINREVRIFVINSSGQWTVDTSEPVNPINIT